jgi:hypothetical protein
MGLFGGIQTLSSITTTPDEYLVAQRLERRPEEKRFTLSHRHLARKEPTHRLGWNSTASLLQPRFKSYCIGSNPADERSDQWRPGGVR